MYNGEDKENICYPFKNVGEAKMLEVNLIELL